MNVLGTNLISINRLVGGEHITYGVKMIGAPLEWKETMAADINIGMIDTGIDCNHEDLRTNIRKIKNFTNSLNELDENGHGTHVAGIAAAAYNNKGIVGVAPKSNLYVAKAFDKAGIAKEDAIISSINWLCDCGVHIINMSFSSEYCTAAYHYAIESAYKGGVCIVCAAGNCNENGSSCIGYPAKLEQTISVTAVDLNKKCADFSIAGMDADIAAAGVNIYSTYPNNRYATLSGTSMATPLISGAIALIQSKAKRRMKRFLTPSEVKLFLSMYSETTHKNAVENCCGKGIFSFGRLDRSEFI